MPLLKIDRLVRSFGPTRALAGASLELDAGEIVALMGANGAGKSTLVNILSGALDADSGTITFAGHPYAVRSPADAGHAGIVTVHQSTDRVGAPGLTVADTLLLNSYADGSAPFFVSRRTIRRKARDILTEAGFELPLDQEFADLSAADRQLVAIARAVARKALVLILDEPTASISGPESERLYRILKRLRGEGMAILYISHRIADLEALADRVAVMRGGQVVGSFNRPVDFEKAVETMIGRPLQSARPDTREATGAPIFEMRNASLLPGTIPFDLDLHAGEVVAISGVLGAGKSRLLSAIFGNAALAGGTMYLDGNSYAPASVRAAIDAGVFMAAEDRHRSSLMPADWPGSTLAATISLPHLAIWFPSGFLLGRREQAEAGRAIHRLGIRASGPDAAISSLSGGNQQKVILGRWEAEPSRLLLLDEPFQGVDVGARHDIITAIRANTQRATLIATSDPEEALEVADRILFIDHHTLTPAALSPASAQTFEAAAR
ncbi:sugar ABC transporter ATP-binding protein [Pararhizobium sp. A13]|uniref:sugar ABC transporter ATP-binding protein n=1 Tax=Pararhizobium sp. A13 TaxID=3133975 RepID=UPI003246A364